MLSYLCLFPSLTPSSRVHTLWPYVWNISSFLPSMRPFVRLSILCILPLEVDMYSVQFSFIRFGSFFVLQTLARILPLFTWSFGFCFLPFVFFLCWFFSPFGLIFWELFVRLGCWWSSVGRLVGWCWHILYVKRCICFTFAMLYTFYTLNFLLAECRIAHVSNKRHSVLALYLRSNIYLEKCRSLYFNYFRQLYPILWAANKKHYP